jgi:transcriptional regulator with XRE-family HTH domain
MTEHKCKLRAAIATVEKPYHYVDSGLSNVYLIGVKYWACSQCPRQAAEIPAVEQLLNVIAKTVVMKPALMTGAEIRFLRKRVGKKQADFAALVDLTPEHFSKLENDLLPLPESTDKLIRLTYGMLSGDRQLLLQIMPRAEEWLRSIGGKKQAKIRIRKAANNNWAPVGSAA